MSNLQLPDVLDLVYKHPLFQQKIYETQVSWSSKVSFSGCQSPTHHSPHEHLVDAMLPRQMERPSLFDWKDRATKVVLQPTRWGTPWGKHQATSRTKSHCERFRTQVLTWVQKKTSSDFASWFQTFKVASFFSQATSYGSALTPGAQRLVEHLHNTKAVLGGFGSQENWKPRKLQKDSQDSHLLLQPNKNAWTFCCFCFCFCSIHPYALRSILSM